MTTASVIDSAHLYDSYCVSIEVRDRLDGGVPRDPELIQKWVESKTGHADEQTQAQIEDHMPDVDAATEDVASKMWCGFKRDDQGPFIETRQVKAMFRECATVLGITSKKRGSRQILQHAFEIKGDGGGPKIHITAKDEGTDEGPIHIMTPKGPRSAIKRTDYVGPGSTLFFEIWVLSTAPQEKRHLGESDIRRMLGMAQENGLGANRSQGSGKFNVTNFSMQPAPKTS